MEVLSLIIKEFPVTSYVDRPDGRIIRNNSFSKNMTYINIKIYKYINT